MVFSINGIIAINLHDPSFTQDTVKITLLYQATEYGAIQGYIHKSCESTRSFSVSKCHFLPQNTAWKRFKIKKDKLHNIILSNKVFDFYLFIFHSCSGRMVDLRVACGNVRGNMSLIIGHSDHHSHVEQVDICHQESRMKFLTVSPVVSLYIGLPFLFTPRNTELSFRQTEIKKQHDPLVKGTYYVNFRRISVQNWRVKHIRIKSEGNFVIVRRFYVRKYKFINLTIRGSSESKYPCTNCVMMGFNLFDGYSTFSDIIGPYCAAFGIDDPFGGTSLEVCYAQIHEKLPRQFMFI